MLKKENVALFVSFQTSATAAFYLSLGAVLVGAECVFFYFRISSVQHLPKPPRNKFAAD